MIIKTKIITVIALIIILTVGTTTVVVIQMQKRKVARAGIRETEFICDLIESTTESSLSEGKTADIQEIFESAGRNREITKLRILSPEGVVLESMDRSEIGSRPAGLSASSLNTLYKSPAFVNDVMVSCFRGIPNRRGCVGCHGSQKKILGIIQITRDRSKNHDNFLTFERLMLLSCFAIVLIVSTTMSSVFSRLVMNPLKSLLSAMREVEAGNWNAEVNVGSDDELGEIASSFNKMIREVNNLHKKNILKERELSKVRVELEHKAKVEELNSQLEFNIRGLETANEAITALSNEVNNKNFALEQAVERLKKINEVGRILSSIVETKELMRIIIRTTADLLNAEKVTMHLRNASNPPVTLQYVRGKGIEHLQTFSLELQQDYPDLVAHGKPVLLSVAVPGKEGSGSRTPGIAVPLKIKGGVMGAMIVENSSASCSFTEDELEVLTTLSNQAMVAIENAWLYESVKNSYFATIQSLVNALEASDRFTKGHSERVRLLSVELGKYIGLQLKELELLEHASILHDIGKIGIDNFVLQKQGKLTSREYGLVKTHPLIGDEILGPIETLEGVRKTIIQHHERYDGTGYPYGLKGDEILLKSRILSVVDTFDAMMTDRPYRKAIGLKLVMAELGANVGTQFDPEVVKAFTEMLEKKGDQILSLAGYNTLLSI
jgi:HD-GYP domain-containing protein (c-di-GMP phosphodiesterase class II)